MRCETEGPSQTFPLSLGLGPGPSLPGPDPDQLALKLRQPSQHRQHQPTVRGGGIGPGVGQRAEPRPLVGNSPKGVQEIEGRAGQPVEPRDQYDITGRELIKQASKLGAVGFSPARHLAEHFDCTCGGQSVDLGVDALAVR